MKSTALAIFIDISHYILQKYVKSKDSQNPTMSSPIKTVGVIGAGVIGASWTALFLAKGLQVIVTDPAPGAGAKLRGYLQEYCSAVPNAMVAPAACLKNYTFVKDIEPYLGSLDMIQEVSGRSSLELLCSSSCMLTIMIEWARKIRLQTPSIRALGRKDPFPYPHRILLLRPSVVKICH